MQGCRCGCFCVRRGAAGASEGETSTRAHRPTPCTAHTPSSPPPSIPRHAVRRTTLQAVGIGLAATAVTLTLLINSQLDADGAYGAPLSSCCCVPLCCCVACTEIARCACRGDSTPAGGWPTDRPSSAPPPTLFLCAPQAAGRRASWPRPRRSRRRVSAREEQCMGHSAAACCMSLWAPCCWGASLSVLPPTTFLSLQLLSLPAGIIFSSSVREMGELLSDDEAAEREAEAQVGL